MKLYLIKLKGMSSMLLTGSVTYGVAYVVAEDATKAYETVRQYLDKENIGFAGEREMYSVQLLADTAQYPLCKIKLYLPEGVTNA